jgi:hypothetical protein
MSEIIKICPPYNLHQFLILYVKVYIYIYIALFLVIQCCSIYILIYELNLQRLNMNLLFKLQMY